MDKPFPDMSVLLVEDNALVGEIMNARLSRLVSQVFWGRDGLEGLAMYRSHHPSLVLVDELMPNMKGSEMVAEIRKTDKATVLVGLTASTLGRECSDLLAAGADLALDKPLGVAQLSEILRDMVDTR